MARVSTLWTPSLKLELHQLIAGLRRLTDIPSGDYHYPGQVTTIPNDHVISFKDELHIADGLAFLAHRDEGVGNVSAVTLQERQSCLVIVLASNSTLAPTRGEGECTKSKTTVSLRLGRLDPRIANFVRCSVALQCATPQEGTLC